MTLNEEAPCQTCGSPVRIRVERGQRSITDVAALTDRKRVCTSWKCPTNGRDKGMDDVV